MQEIYQKYTDDEILRYYPLVTAEGRKMRRLLLEVMKEIDEIDESTQEKDIDMLYETAKRVLPQVLTSELDKCFCEGYDSDLHAESDMFPRNIFMLTSKLYRIYYKYHGV